MLRLLNQVRKIEFPQTQIRLFVLDKESPINVAPTYKYQMMNRGKEE
jgi:hypothetical protein